MSLVPQDLDLELVVGRVVLAVSRVALPPQKNLWETVEAMLDDLDRINPREIGD